MQTKLVRDFNCEDNAKFYFINVTSTNKQYNIYKLKYKKHRTLTKFFVMYTKSVQQKNRNDHGLYIQI